MITRACAITLSNNPVYHSCTKHITVYHHFIRDSIVSKEVKLEHVNTLLNTTDILMKSLLSELHQKHCTRLGLTQLGSARDKDCGDAEQKGLHISPELHTQGEGEN